MGMSGIARLFLDQGYAVQGSDLKKSDVLADLEKSGAKVMIGHDAAYVNGADFVVYSSSIAENHPERAAAAGRKIPILHRAEALAELCRGRFTIAVTGTHGKTTTTALIGMILKEAGRDPSIVVGGVVQSFGGNACCGKGNEMVIEADESDSSFLRFSPNLEVITNIDEDHMEHFKTPERVERAYRDFVGRLEPGGEWFGASQDERVRRLAAEGGRPASLYGLGAQGNAVYATDAVECPQGRRGVAFKVWAHGRYLGQVQMKTVGLHNVLNALAAVSVGLKLGISFDVIARALGRYEGTRRRFGIQFEGRDFLVVDDYAHHPTEIQKTLLAARSLKPKRLFAVFEPHRFTRTEFHLQAFAKSFPAADKVVITDIYAASETPLPGVSGQAVCEAAKAHGHPDATYVARPDVKTFVENQMRSGDLILVLGAGGINQVAMDIGKELKRRLFSAVRGTVLSEEPLSRHTSLKIGGPAEFWAEPEDIRDLRTVLKIAEKENLKVTVFGAGSNLLAPDEGLKGIVIHLKGAFFKEAWLEKEGLRVRAGLPNTQFIQFAVENGFGGCEFLTGIPGNIGGAVAMNAGSHGQSVDSLLEELTLVTFNGQIKTLAKKDVPFCYRSWGLKDCVVIEALFRLPRITREETQKVLDEYRDYRLKTQDLKHPSAGCMFKNGGPTCSAGRLIDETGLKGFTVGRAQVSPVHANFIINLGGATSRDVMSLIEQVRKRVLEKHGVYLETEVKILDGTGLDC